MNNWQAIANAHMQLIGLCSQVGFLGTRCARLQLAWIVAGNEDCQMDGIIGVSMGWNQQTADCHSQGRQNA